MCWRPLSILFRLSTSLPKGWSFTMTRMWSCYWKLNPRGGLKWLHPKTNPANSKAIWLKQTLASFCELALKNRHFGQMVKPEAPLAFMSCHRPQKTDTWSIPNPKTNAANRWSIWLNQKPFWLLWLGPREQTLWPFDWTGVPCQLLWAVTDPRKPTLCPFVQQVVHPYGWTRGPSGFRGPGCCWRKQLPHTCQSPTFKLISMHLICFA